jgi:hypothetical protein
MLRAVYGVCPPLPCWPIHAPSRVRCLPPPPTPSMLTYACSEPGTLLGCKRDCAFEECCWDSLWCWGKTLPCMCPMSCLAGVHGSYRLAL